MCFVLCSAGRFVEDGAVAFVEGEGGSALSLRGVPPPGIVSHKLRVQGPAKLPPHRTTQGRVRDMLGQFCPCWGVLKLCLARQQCRVLRHAGRCVELEFQIGNSPAFKAAWRPLNSTMRLKLKALLPHLRQL